MKHHPILSFTIMAWFAWILVPKGEYTTTVAAIYWLGGSILYALYAIASYLREFIDTYKNRK